MIKTIEQTPDFETWVEKQDDELTLDQLERMFSNPSLR